MKFQGHITRKQGVKKIDRQMRQEKSAHNLPTSLCKSMTEQALGETEKKTKFSKS